MKTRNKVLLLVMCMLLVAAGSVMATMAYLMDSDEVVNTFTVGKVKLQLDETDVDVNGNKDGDTRVKANTYHLLPGQTYTKDPMVTVLDGSEDCYVRMLVTLNRTQTQLDEIFGAGFLPQNHVAGWDSTVWECTKVDTTTDTAVVTYEFRYRDTAATGTASPYTFKKQSGNTSLDPLFDAFTVPGTVNGDKLAKLAETPEFKITVVAHAIQAAGFDTEDAAWTAFQQQWERENTTQP